ncbi:M20 aminoacylase family protein [Pseudomonas sp. O64]|uniref:M20 aminoacylase family protein n=1 Tax=unclassified Pseudomonas TaxID=196821 RepID=UPI0021DA7336|nr:M20 aminoacylase family protein [Pseudomonas sp. YeP6b]UXZ23772.1 amidohydrolase [Pseudomonas sp. YeP6b]
MTTHPVDAIQAHLQALTALRRDLHAHPELGFDEHRTSAIVADFLQQQGIKVHRGLAGTGVIGIIEGAQPGGSMGLRADMDCLPMVEANDFAHRSIHPGLMHGCGHDGHTVMLLAAARYLAQTRRFSGKVIVIFQPAEEGGGGAKVMIEQGLFKQFPMDSVYALHNNPDYPAGVIAVQPGPVEAAADSFEIIVTGLGGHAAIPHAAIDPVLAASHIVVALQSIVSRNLHPLESGVVTVASLQTSQLNANNVIPAHVKMIGTARSFTSANRDLLERRIGEIAQGVATAFGATASYDYQRGYPATVNHTEQALFAAEVARSLVGEANVRCNEPLTMGAEDFSYMLQERPGAYIYLGQGGSPSEGVGHCQLHNDRYDFNDSVIPLGAGLLASLVEQGLPLS